MKPLRSGKPSSYELTINDNEDKYTFDGARSTSDSQYALYFDADRRVFVLDKIDSTFNMNLTGTPTNTNFDDLSRKYPQLNKDGKSKLGGARYTTDKDKTKRPSKARATSPLVNLSKGQDANKQQQKPPALPKPEQPQSKAKQKQRKSLPDEYEEEEEEDDGGLLVEYPGSGDPKSKQTDFSPAVTAVRRFDEFMDQRESEADDADGESDLDMDNDFKLPSPRFQGSKVASPLGRHGSASDPDQALDADQEDSKVPTGAFDDLDLEKDLEDAFENIGNSPKISPADDESEISEED